MSFTQIETNPPDDPAERKIMKTRFIGFKVTHKWGKPRVRKAHYRHYRTK